MMKHYFVVVKGASMESRLHEYEDYHFLYHKHNKIRVSIRSYSYDHIIRYLYMHQKPKTLFSHLKAAKLVINFTSHNKGFYGTKMMNANLRRKPSDKLVNREEAQSKSSVYPHVSKVDTTPHHSSFAKLYYRIKSLLFSPTNESNVYR